MESVPHLKIYLAPTGLVNVEGSASFHGRPVDFSFDLSEVQGGPSAPPALGKLVHAVLGDWHAGAFAAAGVPAPQFAPVFGDLEVVEKLIGKSVREKTRAFVDAVDYLIAHHAEDQHADFWKVLAEDWPVIQRSIP